MTLLLLLLLVLGPIAVGVDGGLLWLLVQLLLVGGFEGHLRIDGPTLVGEGVIGGSSPSSSALIGGVRITLLRKTSGFNLRSSSSSISSLPPNSGEVLLLLPRHFRLASGVEKLRPVRPLLDARGGGTKWREDGGALDPPALLPDDRGGDPMHAGVLPPLSGSVLIRKSFRFSAAENVAAVAVPS